MPIGQIEIALRPIKLAFLVDPNEKDAVLRAIQINTFLWGGMFNPIIPVFRKRPKNWEPFPSQRITPSEIISGYLNAYDPDFVVPLGRCTNGVSFLPSREVINADDILSTIQDEQVPNYGIGLFELLNHIYEQEFKFVRTHPPRIAVPALSSKHHLFLASIFGVPPADIDATIRERYDKPLSIERPQVSITDYTKLLTPKYLFLRRISAWQLRTRRGTGYREGQSVFYMDASNTLDVIDYWNLRAIGWGVIPVARQVTSDNHIREIVIKFIEENYVPYRHNQQMYHQTTILKSRHVTEDEVFAFAQSLDLAPPKDPHSSKYVYSMIWDNWAREKDEVDYCEIEADTQTHEFQEIPKTLSFRTVDPPMLFQYRGTDTPCFANTIKLRFFGHDADPMADIIPEGDERVVHAIGAIGWREWRVGPRGLIYLSHYRGDRIIFNPPRAEEVFSSWLKANGWEVNLSSPGRIAKQVLKQVDGVWGISGLASPGVISLLVRKLSEGKILSKDGLWAEANKIAQQQKRIFQPTPSGVIQSLTDRNIIRLGVNIQCPVCQQHSWHSVSALDYQVSCEKCLHEFRIPSHSPDDLQWAYRAFGPFSLPKGAYGVYPVLLTLRFFAQVLDGATTPIMSFEAKGHGYKVEADLGCLKTPF